MGERSKDALGLDFDRKPKVKFYGTKVTGDADLLARISHELVYSWAFLSECRLG